MNTKQFIGSLILWLILLITGARWALGPSLWQKPNPITTEQIKAAFPLHLAKVPEGLNEPLPEPDDDILTRHPKLITNDWIYCEVRNRFVVFFFSWIASGFLIHWLLGRILRDRSSWLDELPEIKPE